MTKSHKAKKAKKQKKQKDSLSQQVSQSLISSSSSDEDKRIKPLDDESYKRIKKEVFLVVDSEMNTVYQINDRLTWAAQKHDVITKLLPPLKRKINKKYKVTGAEIIKMLQRCHRSRHRVNNIGNQGPRAVINDSRRKLKNTAMNNKKKRRRRAVDFMMQGGNKYIKRYPKKDLSKILNNSGYYSEEWEETDDGTTATARTAAASTSAA
ncbi:hypothetical protein Glove_30g153 [Diversispora epigaea]|uniref:Uncharacterized protein n=1 Tax=Diversispora epigaea TaxID=1348612 RepID=A0A397JLR6_9GLOM|nr:hypothetical protein Glove_30g153 [Diversispora epigaea]